MRVIIYGATGMVGEGVLYIALRSSTIKSILVLGRRSCGVSHPKLTEILVTDFFNYGAFEHRLQGYDACFFCLGVSSVGRSEADYTRTTYDLTMYAARILARLNPSMTFCYVSGSGTDSTEQGRLMWARVKGRTENHLMLLPFKRVYAFRPAAIVPMPGMQHTLPLVRALAWLFPVVQRISPNYVCTLEAIGRSMIRVAEQGADRQVLECNDITRLAAG